VGGVCGGIAEWSGIDVAVVRLLAVLFMLMGHGLILYAVAWLLLPDGATGPSAFERHRGRLQERRRERRARRAGPRPAAAWDPAPNAAA
jgi:phage shock protein PspC (stress-responsive transcriptional regulator)